MFCTFVMNGAFVFSFGKYEDYHISFVCSWFLCHHHHVFVCSKNVLTRLKPTKINRFYYVLMETKEINILKIRLKFDYFPFVTVS